MMGHVDIATEQSYLQKIHSENQTEQLWGPIKDGSRNQPYPEYAWIRPTKFKFNCH
jgi:hypothetical protein